MDNQKEQASRLSDDIESPFEFRLKLIRSHSEKLQELESKFKSDSRWHNFDDTDSDMWCWTVMGHSLEKLNHLILNSVRIDTFSLVSTTRFVFELATWLILFDRNSDYGFLYRREMLESHIQHDERLIDQSRREIKLLKEFDELESQMMESEIKRLITIEDPELLQREKAEFLDKIHETVDALAARKFSVFAEDAKQNGYGFQAVLVESLIAAAEARLATNKQTLEQFQRSLSDTTKRLIEKKRPWSKKCKTAGLIDEYRFVYSMTSRFLHASPIGISTNQKHLTIEELNTLLKFINVKTQDCIALAENWLKSNRFS